MNPEKSELRKYFLAQRRSLSLDDWRNSSLRLCQNLARQQPFQNAQTILSYCTYRNEPDLSSLLSEPKIWGLPRCVGKKLAWHEYKIPAKINKTFPSLGKVSKAEGVSISYEANGEPTPNPSQKGQEFKSEQMGDRLVSGKFGIIEPHPDLPLIDLKTIDLILVPAVACTKMGDRLGYGGGFYDRFFATLTRQITTIGIVFNCCLTESLPTDSWDQSLDYVCTETDFYDCQ